MNNQNQLSHHTNQYGGNQPGHNSFPGSSFSSGSSISQPAAGKSGYQPSGFVQSFYNPKPRGASNYQSPTNNRGSISGGGFTGGANAPQPQSYHTASYRGDQLGRPSYSQRNTNMPARPQGPGTASYHTAGYTGNQPGTSPIINGERRR